MSLSTSPWRTKNWLFFVNVIALHRQVSIPPSLLPSTIPNSPILGLNLAGIAQHPDIDKQLAGRLQGAGEVDVGPAGLVRGHEVGVRARKLLLAGTEVAALRLSARALQRVPPRPHRLLDARRPHPVVRQQAPLVAPHRQVRHQQRAGRVRRGGRVEGAAEGREKSRCGAVLRADFAHDGLGQLGLVGRERGESLRALGVLHLWWWLEGGERGERARTSFVPRSPYMLVSAVR